MPAGPARASLASMVRVGLIGFGGGSALIPLMEDELVARRRILDRATFSRHIVVASITPGALPVKLGGLAGTTVGGAWLCLTMATLVSLPGTAATVGILSAVRSGGQGVIRYVELASVGVTVFIIALLVHYVGKVLTSEGSGWLVAAGIATLSFLATGAADAAEFIGHLIGRQWQPSVPRLTAVQLVASALVIIALRAALRRGHPARLPAIGHDGGLGAAAVLRSTALLLSVAAGATAAAALVGGKEALALMALVALSTLTSFGGGEAYVGVADGFFVGGGHLSADVFYSQVVPVANALPGPILVKIAAGVGYGATAPTQGATAAWVVAAAGALLAVTVGTAVAVLVLGAYHRAQRSAVVRDIGLYILPVICGLLITTSLSMLNAGADVSIRAGVQPWLTLWLSLAATVLVTWLRHRRSVHDAVLILLCGAASLAAMTAA